MTDDNYYPPNDMYYWIARENIPTGSWDSSSGLHRVLILCMAMELIGLLAQSPLDFFVNGLRED